MALSQEDREERETRRQERRARDEQRYGWKREPAALYADTFEVGVSKSSGIVRMAFGEYAGSLPAFHRLAVAMPISDTKEFIRVLGELIQDAEGKGPATDG